MRSSSVDVNRNFLKEVTRNLKQFELYNSISSLNKLFEHFYRSSDISIRNTHFLFIYSAPVCPILTVKQNSLQILTLPPLCLPRAALSLAPPSTLTSSTPTRPAFPSPSLSRLVRGGLAPPLHLLLPLPHIQPIMRLPFVNRPGLR